jgi:hypothetical protein
MFSLEQSFNNISINTKKRNKNERYENVNEIDDLFKNIKIVNDSEEEMGDDEEEMGDDDDESIIRHEKEYKNLIGSWNTDNNVNIDSTEDTDFPDKEKEIYGYETLYEGFYSSNDFDYWTSENDFNDNE